ncbi:MAG: CYTH domain-containing protein [Candidatus Diapherotrites archaeon]|nr:CYTH domain-containing protein [Candidatus Diapherotrites archaeon]
MKNEYQYKFPISSRNDFTEKLQSENIKLTEPTIHTYTYFELPVKTSAFAVLRIKESAGKETIDMKIRNNQSGQWERFETQVEEPNQLRKILEGLGCNPIVTFRKTRQTFVNSFIRLDLDSTKELGTFLETKFLADNKKKAEEFLADLEIDVTKHDKRSVIEIYLSKKAL